MRARLPQIDPVVGRLSLVHLLVDAYGNVYAPLVPLLIPRLHLSLLAAGTLAMLFQLAASVAQLGFGYLADRWRPRLLVTAGPVVAVGLLSLAGLASSAAMLALVLVAGGLGTAAFHPSAAALVHRLGGPRTGLAMSIYITGGTLGFSFAPLVFAPLAERFGPASTAILAPPGLAAVLLLLRRLPEVETTADPRAGGLRILVPYARPLALLYLIVVLRTLTSIGFTVFVPVLLTARGLSAAEAGSVVALFLFASGIGGFFGGPAADRWGPRTVIIASLVAAAPLLFLAPRLEGVWFALALAAGGFALQSTLPVNVTFGQAIAPVSAATVSSLMMGFAWGSGGLLVPLVGLAADRAGVAVTLQALAAAPLAGALCAWPLPPGRLPHPAARPADVGIAERT